MRRATLIVAILAAGLGVPAAAAPPQSTTFTVVEQFDLGTGVFASDGSVVCASGTTSNDTFGSGFQSDRGGIFHVRKTITCNDGSGTFTLLIQARVGINVGNMAYGPWVVLSGTGDYADLHGRGIVTGTPVPGGISDLYVGWLALG
jgi:hypothetical protein